MMRVLEKAARVMFVAGGALLLMMLALTLTNIGMRFFLGSSLRGAVEISGCLCAAGIGLCLPMAQMQGCHVAAGMAEERLPMLWRKVQAVLVMLVSAGLLLVAATEIVSLGLFVMEVDERIDGWDFSYYGLVFALAAGCAVQALAELAPLAHAAGRAVRRHGRRTGPEDAGGPSQDAGRVA